MGLPKELFVKTEEDSGEEYYVATANLFDHAEQDTKVVVGRYVLIGESILTNVTYSSVTHTLHKGTG